MKCNPDRILVACILCAPLLLADPSTLPAQQGAANGPLPIPGVVIEIDPARPDVEFRAPDLRYEHIRAIVPQRSGNVVVVNQGKFPDRFQPLAFAHGFTYGVWRDADDVECVRAYDLRGLP